MARTLKLYQGADMDPEWDYSEWVEWPDCDFGVRAHNGEATQGVLRIRDVLGETGSELNLPGGLTFRSVAAHSTMTLTEDASGAEKHIWRGWVIPKDYTRGVQKADRAREISVSVEDYQAELRGIIVGRDAPEVRPAETDVERVEWLRATYLNGDPRASTVIGDGFIAAGNTVALEAKTYEDATVDEVLRDCALPADKAYWVVLNDDGTMDLFYDIITSAAYSSTLEIRQTGDPTEVDDVTTFAPKWDVGPASREDGQQLLSGLKLKGPPGVSAYVNHAGTVSDYNHFEEVINDDLVQTDAQAAAKAQGILNVRRFELRTYSCSILVPADRVHLIKAGMNITIQAKAIPDADDQVVTRRIGQCRYQVYNNELYKVTLQLDRPLRAGPFGTGSPVGPRPPTPPTPGGSVRLYPSDQSSGSSSKPEANAAPNLNSGHIDAAWDIDALDDYYYMFEPTELTTTTANTSWAQVNAPVGYVIAAGFVHRLDGDLLDIIQAGGTVHGQFLAKSRHGIGISEASQENYADWCVRVYRPGTGFVATLLDVGDSTSATRFLAQSTAVNRSWDGSIAAYPSAADGDYIVVDLGLQHNFPTSGGTGATIYWNDGAASDLPEDQLETANLRAWIEFRGPTVGDSTSPTVPPGQGSVGDAIDVYSPIDHEHEHGLLADDGIHMHDADQIDGLDTTPASSATVELGPDAPITVKDDGQNNSFPGLTRLANGNLILVYRVGTDHSTTQDGKIIRRISTDDGATWGAESDVINPADDARDPEVVVLRDGTVAVSYVEYDGTAAGFSLWLTRSTDNGSTWDTPVQITTTVAVASSAGRIVELPDGDLIHPLYGNAAGVGNWSAYLVRSTDGGDTWGSQVTIATGAIGSGSNWTEPYILRLSDGRLLCAIREETDKDIYLTYSEDDGVTWSTPELAFDGWGKPFLLETTAGAVICVTRSQESTQHTIYRVSWDLGDSWEDEQTLDSQPGMTYASGVQVGQRIIIAFSVEHNYTGAATNADVFVADLIDVSDHRFSNESRLTVTEEDGSPIAHGVTELRFTNASLTANADGSVSVAAGGGAVDPDDVMDAGRWEVVVSGTAPPVAVTNEAEDDWLYSWVPGP